MAESSTARPALCDVLLMFERTGQRLEELERKTKEAHNCSLDCGNCIRELLATTQANPGTKP